MRILLVLLGLTCWWGSVRAGSFRDQIAEYSDSCCAAGLAHGLRSTDCSSAMPPASVPQHLGSLCIAAMDSCCQGQLKKKQDCETGSLSSKECAVFSTDTGQETTGPDASPAAPATRADGRSTVAPKASMCELFAPDELCAHHCIPVPGSYRCQCNPGFMLMSDGKSCKKVEKNRCKPNNPCHHKCNDNGKEVTCSCRRGYELMADQKTCTDVDECALDMAVCAAGTSCRNTEGSYRCVPGAASPASPASPGVCPAGFRRNGTNQVCDDINECKLPTPPCARRLCVNTIGGYTCGGAAGRPGGAPPTPVVPPGREQDLCPNGFRIGADGDCADIDECADKSDDCNKLSQFCLNTHGGFACQDRASKHCPPGFTLDHTTGVCQDMDECADSSELCGPELVCVNVAGAYDCKDQTPQQDKVPKKCQEGTRVNPATQICEDIDECREGSHLCDRHQDCLNMFGGHECRCKFGFRLSPTTGACEDVNECAEEGLNTCLAESQRCDNTVGSYVCTRFTSCGTGYVLHASSGQCEDIDECEHKLDNCALAGAGFSCLNLPGTFRCVRQPRPPSSSTTTALPPYEYEYYDSEEEVGSESKPTESASPSPPTTTPLPPPPVVTVPSTTPESPTSAPTSAPPPRATEPAPPPPPPPRSSEPPHTTTEPAPASTEPPRTNAPNTTPTQVVISPPPARVHNGTVVLDTGSLPKDVWTNLVRPEVSPAADQKLCIAGFRKNHEGDCVDIDECSSGAHLCSALTERCRNTEGSYQCDCAPGFRKDARGWCRATSPRTTPAVTTTTLPPPPPPQPRPTLTRDPWSSSDSSPRAFHPRRLQCNMGYHLNTTTDQCDDVDECESGVASCAPQELCVNTEGGYRCECPPGWSLDVAGHRCLPLARYPAGSGNVNTEPPQPQRPLSSASDGVITVGSQYGVRGASQLAPGYTQLASGARVPHCPWGYQLVDSLCRDVDECATGGAACGPSQQCVNHAGGYSCRCPPGHRLGGDNSCEDIDECAISQGRYCGPHSECVNTVGSYSCRCRVGFRSSVGSDKVCVDTDECAEAAPGELCQHACHNVWGSFRCSCHRGFRLAADNRTCVDIDECSEFSSRRLCVGQCVNDVGSYRCACPPGYRLGGDNRSCIDIDECETGQAPCAGARAAADQVCQNTRGGYQCHTVSCPPGYRLEKKHRCTLESRACAASDRECLARPATYSYNFITFVSRLYLPPPPADSVDLFTMRGPSWPHSRLQFTLRLVRASAPPAVRRLADIHCFQMVSSATQAVVSLRESLEGPQSVELELSMRLSLDEPPAPAPAPPHTVSRAPFGGVAVAKIIIYVSEYEF